VLYWHNFRLLSLNCRGPAFSSPAFATFWLSGIIGPPFSGPAFPVSHFQRTPLEPTGGSSWDPTLASPCLAIALKHAAALDKHFDDDYITSSVVVVVVVVEMARQGNKPCRLRQGHVLWCRDIRGSLGPVNIWRTCAYWSYITEVVESMLLSARSTWMPSTRPTYEIPSVNGH